jgi:cyclopropane fatty-acyl-phospholipid synthase-like methyltransferase
MSATEQPVYAAPFDAVAREYDDTFTSSKIGRAQRDAVWQVLGKAFRPGEHILEIGCGTGSDACFLAERGIHVVACDSSPQMVAVTAKKIAERGLQKFVGPQVLSAEDLASLRYARMFDGAFSDFGALNCVADLKQLVRDLDSCVKTGATVVLCWIGPHCLWETAWYLAHGNRQKAFRRFSGKGVAARIADGAFVQVHYPTVSQIARTFAPEFRMKSIRGIGVAVPPSYIENWAQRNPRIFALCQRADSTLGRIPGLRLLADHVLVTLQREGTNSEQPSEEGKLGASKFGAEKP